MPGGKRKGVGRGFSIAELLLSMVILSVITLGVLGLTSTILQTGQEAADTSVGVAVAEAEIQRVISAAQGDPDFWDLDHLVTPYATSSVVADGTAFECEIRAATVMDNGISLGSSSGLVENRLKKVDIVVTWWDSSTTEHQGYGKLETRLSRLVSEIN
jgi:Tfp pilus assembly protein PilV